MRDNYVYSLNRKQKQVRQEVVGRPTKRLTMDKPEQIDALYNISRVAEHESHHMSNHNHHLMKNAEFWKLLALKFDSIDTKRARQYRLLYESARQKEAQHAENVEAVVNYSYNLQNSALASRKTGSTPENSTKSTENSAIVQNDVKRKCQNAKKAVHFSDTVTILQEKKKYRNSTESTMLTKRIRTYSEILRVGLANAPICLYEMFDICTGFELAIMI